MLKSILRYCAAGVGGAVVLFVVLSGAASIRLVASLPYAAAVYLAAVVLGLPEVVAPSVALGLIVYFVSGVRNAYEAERAHVVRAGMLAQAVLFCESKAPGTFPVDVVERHERRYLAWAGHEYKPE